MKRILSGLAACLRGAAPNRPSTLSPPKPAVPQPFNTAQIKLVLQLNEVHLGAPTQAALQLEAWTKAGVFSTAQRSVVSGLLRLEYDDLMRTLCDCAGSVEARTVVREELLRKALARPHGQRA